MHFQEREKGLYSMYFLVPKKTGEFRPILDLRSLQKVPYVNQLLELGQPGDWFTTIDLKDAYFHVENCSKAQKVFAFCLPGG